jgi:hypothetical protein
MQFEREYARFSANGKMNSVLDRPKWREVHLITGLLFICIAFLLMPSLSHGQKTSPQVLILNSYHQGYEWSDKEQTGLIARLMQEYPTIDPAIEDLDTKRFLGADHLLRISGEKDRPGHYTGQPGPGIGPSPPEPTFSKGPDRVCRDQRFPS